MFRMLNKYNISLFYTVYIEWTQDKFVKFRSVAFYCGCKFDRVNVVFFYCSQSGFLVVNFVNYV